MIRKKSPHIIFVLIVLFISFSFDSISAEILKTDQNNQLNMKLDSKNEVTTDESIVITPPAITATPPAIHMKVPKPVIPKKKSIVPINLVTKTAVYDYKTLEKDIEKIKRLKLKNVSITVIGKSVLKRNIYLIKIGNGYRKLMITGATHGREYITSILTMDIVQTLIKEFYFGNVSTKTNSILHIYNLDKKSKNMTIYIIPMLNPDGVDFVLHGVPKNLKNYSQLIKINKGTNFLRWKNNANGIDINDNFNFDLKVKVKESEPETKAAANLMRSIKPNILLNFHCTGEQIYSSGMMRYKSIRSFGYQLQKLSGFKFGLYYINKNGFTDYAGRFGKGNILPYTIEFGTGNAPVPMTQYKKMWENCCSIIKFCLLKLY